MQCVITCAWHRCGPLGVLAALPIRSASQNARDARTHARTVTMSPSAVIHPLHPVRLLRHTCKGLPPWCSTLLPAVRAAVAAAAAATPQAVLTHARTDGLVVYMGKDKFENEELLKYGFPEDVWFHVDDLSSAHVYLRMPLVRADHRRLRLLART